jgi:hypothetical protein
LRLRWRRARLHLRAWAKRQALRAVADRTAAIAPDDILLMSVLRNERVRLPYFLQYYRALGVGHFLMVDNGSDDGSGEFLLAQPDVSLWRAAGGYREARFGMDWITHLQNRHADGHWTLTVDLDEFLIYPFCETRPLRALTDWLEGAGLRALSAMILDLYPRGALEAQAYAEGQDPFAIAGWFDAANYSVRRSADLGNLWIQGGPRARLFFADMPERAPALNKVPLVKWRRGYVYASSTHMLLPRGLNQTYERAGGEQISGCLLHAKFLDGFPARAAEEVRRRQHYADGHEYRAYAQGMQAQRDLWCRWSERYVNWRQLEMLGLMSKGNWA